MTGMFYSISYPVYLTLRFVDDGQDNALKVITLEKDKYYLVSYIDKNNSIIMIEGKLISMSEMLNKPTIYDGFVRDSSNTNDLLELEDIYSSDKENYWHLNQFPKKNLELVFDTGDDGGEYEIVNLYSIRDIDEVAS